MLTKIFRSIKMTLSNLKTLPLVTDMEYEQFLERKKRLLRESSSFSNISVIPAENMTEKGTDDSTVSMDHKLLVDHSLKGCIDLPISPLCSYLNTIDSFMTLSSCSGRITLYLRPANHEDSAPTNDHFPVDRIQAERSADHNSKYHDSTATSSCSIKQQAPYGETEQDFDWTAGSTYTTCSLSSLFGFPSSCYSFEIILKMEPFILHVETLNLRSAKALLDISKICGLKQSGISALGKRLVVALRGSSSFEAPIISLRSLITDDAFPSVSSIPSNDPTHSVSPLVPLSTLIYFLKDCCQKLKRNTQQIDRLYSEIVKEKFLEALPNEHALACNGPSRAKPTKMKAQKQPHGLLNDGQMQSEEMKMIPIRTQTINWEPIVLNGRLKASLEGWGYATAFEYPYIFLYGGFRRCKRSAMLTSFNIETMEWSERVSISSSDEPLDFVYSNLIALGDGFLALMGGRQSPTKASMDVYLFDITVWKWIRMNCDDEKLPIPRWRHACCLMNEGGESQDGKIYLPQRKVATVWMLGGTSSANPLDDGILGDFWRLDISIERQEAFNNSGVVAVGHWKLMDSGNSMDAPGPIHSHSIFTSPSFPACLAVLGGVASKQDSSGRSPKDLEILHIFDTRKQLWRIEYTQTSVQNTLCSLKMDSLSNSTPTSQVDGNSFTPIKHSEHSHIFKRFNYTGFPTPRFAHSVAFLAEKNAILLVGGCDGSQGLNDTWLLLVDTLKWYYLGSVPGTNSGLRSRLICGRNELFLMGGGFICFTFGSFFDVPLIAKFKEGILKGIDECLSHHVQNSSSHSSSQTLPCKNSTYPYEAWHTVQNRGCPNEWVSDAEHISYETIPVKSGIQNKSMNSVSPSDSIAGFLFIGILKSNWIKAIKSALDHCCLFDRSRKIVKPPRGICMPEENLITAEGSVGSQHFLLKQNLKNEQAVKEDLDKSFSPSPSVWLPVVRRVEITDLPITFLENEVLVLHKDEKQAVSFQHYTLSTEALNKENRNVTNWSRNSIASNISRSWYKALNDFYSTEVSSDISISLPPPPTKFEKLGKIILFPTKSFEALTQIRGFMAHSSSHRLLKEIASYFEADSVGTLGKTSGPMRQSEVKLLFGNEKIAHVKENGVSFRFDVTKCMFSSGNTSERMRIASLMSKLSNSKEVVIDMFCGIGYFSIPILVATTAAQVSRVYACDWNPHALQAFRWNAVLNNVCTSRFHLLNCDSRTLGDTADVSGIKSGIAQRILLGLIPNSEASWAAAVRMLDKSIGGTIHIHSVCGMKPQGIETSFNSECKQRDSGSYKATERTTTTIQIEAQCFSASVADYSVFVCEKFGELFRILDPFQTWNVEIVDMVKVKSYAPKLWHYVVDIACQPVAIRQ
ncbi:kelch repeat-containing protein [Cardiosporidium cionae]|uniref:tRNA(Phe) 7-[(3-amino-3-carboxypropyl)-4-demethylwyosine(37)-N(4)]-methyltransferase n=1 Tax=Cardiosporidium cionae TaxID=476202 RepID=A0ABQ7JEP1_9APIC|nr:kelch repeat-containing protein [Cardiosporidium cionae]|eukprot:KAF8822424.1 kelch repeat-containing protein [Cardiosporidium cionae]